MLDVELPHTALAASRVAADPLDQMQCLQDKAGRRGRRSASPSHADAPESPQAESALLLHHRRRKQKKQRRAQSPRQALRVLPKSA